jgi:hypothetical protein
MASCSVRPARHHPGQSKAEANARRGALSIKRNVVTGEFNHAVSAAIKLLIGLAGGFCLQGAARTRQTARGSVDGDRRPALAVLI